MLPNPTLGERNGRNFGPRFLATSKEAFAEIPQVNSCDDG